MLRHHAMVIGALAAASVCLTVQLSARPLAPDGVTARPATAAGRVQGLVRDAAGKAVADASVLAVGQTVVSARSDAKGRFQLFLPPGEYILKATRAGYVSTYREPVSVQSSTLLERNITLVRQAGAAVDPAVDNQPAETDLAWRLRHRRDASDQCRAAKHWRDDARL
jgi:hypothetical protein